jgi:ABC-type multidrug transport system fused ATPase/permease subunit
MTNQSETVVEDATPQHTPATGTQAATSAGPISADGRRKRLILRYLLGLSWWRASLLAALSILSGFAEAAVLAIVAQVAAALAANRSAVDAHLGVATAHMTIRTLLITGGALAAGRLVLLIPISSLGASLTADAEATLRERLFHAFLRASWAVKSSDREGKLQELMTSQISQATYGVTQTTYVVTYLFSFLALVASALVLSPAAAGIIVGVSVILFAGLRPLSRAGSRAARDLSAAQLEHASGVSEATRLAEETQVFGVLRAQRERLQHLIDRNRQLFFRTQFTVRLIPNLYQSAVYLLLFGGLAIIYVVDRSGLASLGAVVLMLVRAGTYGNQAQNAYQMTRQAIPFIERIQNAIDTYSDAAVQTGSKGFDTLEGVSFRNVSYTYGERSQVLSDITFDVTAGEAMGIIGPSGAGKSTLAQLLLRLRQPDSGEYLVNGIPAGSLRWADWAARVAYVPQTPQLVHASVADNIRYFRDVSREDVERAARLAGIHDDVVAWADGYDTVVGPRAAAVSVGQAQRICLARALALRPQILVLDEPTSALDPTSERLIQESLTALRGSLTLFVIAHRLSTLDICDRVMVIVNGRLDAIERFDDLRARNAYYRSATNTVA